MRKRRDAGEASVQVICTTALLVVLAILVSVLLIDWSQKNAIKVQHEHDQRVEAERLTHGQ